MKTLLIDIDIIAPVDEKAYQLELAYVESVIRELKAASAYKPAYSRKLNQKGSEYSWK